MKIEDILGGIIVGAALTFAGFTLLFQREKVIEALLASNKVFWQKMNYNPNEDRNRTIANIMIPFMGVLFTAGGITSIVKVVLFLFGS